MSSRHPQAVPESPHPGALALMVALLLPWPVFALVGYGHELLRLLALYLEMLP